MLRKINYINILRVLSGLGILAMGFIILSDSEKNTFTITIFLGIAVALQGVSLIMDSSYTKNKGLYPLADLSLGSIYLAFGVILIIDTNINFLLMGIFVIFIAFLSLLREIMVCYERRSAGLKYKIVVGFGIVHLIFIGLIIYSLATDGILLNIFIGAYLLNIGILAITAMVYRRHDSEQV